MYSWKNFKEDRRELAQQYSQTLRNVPQDPVHHPEGDALIHTRLVRKAIPKAIMELQTLKSSNPQFAHILSDIDFTTNAAELEILALSAWLHDIGKATATTIGGQPWQTATEPGRIQAIGHESPEHFEPQLQKLKGVGPPETEVLYLQNKDLIDFLIKHHMDFTSGSGFSKKFVAENFREGKVINSQRLKLLLILMWADKMGRIPEETIASCIAKNATGLLNSSDKSVKMIATKQKNSFEGGPEQFIALLKSKNVDLAQRKQSVINKFPQLSDAELFRLMPENFQFRKYVESVSSEPTTIPANIPVPDEVRILAKVLKQNDSNAQVYIVGGAVRDYLYHLHHGDKTQSYKPKDVDLTSNLSEEEILDRLRSPMGQQFGIRVKEKESVDTFGVVFASVQGSETFEIAPFRKDIGSVDGRRPERTERGSAYDDAMRRDLTMNNLYYDFEKGVILDFNPNGQGIEDVKQKMTRMVGDPEQRLDEDKLRVLRMVRFFSRFNPGKMIDNIDRPTKLALEKFKNLYEFKGITAERIQSEFVAGIKQSLNTSSYLRNYADLGLLESVFPRLQVDVQGIERLGNLKNPRVIIAWLLRGNQNIAKSLNQFKYPNEISEPVEFLINVMSFGPDNAMSILKSRDRRIIKTGRKKPSLSPEEQTSNDQLTAEMQQDLTDLSRIFGADLHPNDEKVARINHLQSYNPLQVNGEDLMKKGLKGTAIGAEQNRQLSQHYNNSFQDFMNKKKDVQ